MIINFMSFHDMKIDSGSGNINAGRSTSLVGGFFPIKYL